jgi:hypothetical protein
VSENGAALWDDPGAAIGPVLGGPFPKGLLNSAAEGVWALKAGDAWIEGEVTVERIVDEVME